MLSEHMQLPFSLPLSMSHYRFSSKETTAASQHKRKKI